MDIILAPEPCAIHLETNSKEKDAEYLRQQVSQIINRNLDIKIRGNLSKSQRKALV